MTFLVAMNVYTLNVSLRLAQTDIEVAMCHPEPVEGLFVNRFKIFKG
jgi:hypothetical protein